MVKNNVICPECDEVLNFQNVFGYEENEMKVEAIVYFITCKKCNTTFATPLRVSHIIGEEHQEMVKDMLEGLKGAMDGKRKK